ncbi:hypothetical protein AL532_17710 [Pseudomonas monteilii]|uniref:DUF6941 family protein n=1 Tax=Pseudomonas TaxID=286 RepID=UPI000CEB4D03|nr:MULTISPECIES: hypothetical protein [Pseudomonas]AVH38046.1 hypothetical protein AL532_17710 [Pseudomonas monteilii]MCA4076441.1 hypothetical protein [Pseudomonas kurunegalensis]MDM9594681.1 hypothetical protein [Pseudomonas guariconensis]MDM9607511.1 hypothetical protein [Pseudomonas guariconensis]MEB3843496.1 hypothetical protein [Pseudomonas guariconensis]
MTRYAHTMFCDDVRHEAGGKVSFMGVYSGNLTASSIPGLLPKLCIAITLYTDLGNPFREISIKGLFGGQEVFSMDLNENDIAQAGTKAEKPASAAGYFVQLLAILTPFQIDDAGKLSVRIIADGEKILTNALRIDPADDA